MKENTITQLGTKLHRELWALEGSTLRSLEKKYDILTAQDQFDDSDDESLPIEPDTQEDLFVTYGNTAVLDIEGVLVKAPSLFEQLFFGAIDMDAITDELDKMSNDETIENIVLNFTSPGGNVNGTPELAEVIRAVSMFKDVYAYSNTMACSAAYWLMSQTKQIYISKSATIGNVGVLKTINIDPDEAKNTTVIKAGKYKGIGYKPLTDEEEAYLQSQVTDTHNMFKSEILSNRPGIDTNNLEGQTFIGSKAVDAGLADGIIANVFDLVDLLNDETDLSGNDNETEDDNE